MRTYDRCKFTEEHLAHMMINDECPWCGASQEITDEGDILVDLPQSESCPDCAGAGSLPITHYGPDGHPMVTDRRCKRCLGGGAVMKENAR